LRHGAGTLYLRVHAADAVLHLLVAQQELARAPRDAGSGASEAAAIQKLDPAVSDMPITLQAQLGSFEIELGALHGLVAGDVIRLGAKIERPLAVVGPDGAILCHGHLGVHDGVRALDLVH
jgi:flagellar motor switch/type III secretory pathway protein FliN